MQLEFVFYSMVSSIFLCSFPCTLLLPRLYDFISSKTRLHLCLWVWQQQLFIPVSLNIAHSRFTKRTMIFNGFLQFGLRQTMSVSSIDSRTIPDDRFIGNCLTCKVWPLKLPSQWTHSRPIYSFDAYLCFKISLQLLCILYVNKDQSQRGDRMRL